MKRKRLIIPLAVTVLLLAAFFIYTQIYYHADPSARDALRSGQTVSVTETGYGWFFDGPSADDVLIFYPGGKVEETAYAPFLHLLAEKGLDVCLVKMPFRLAVFGKNRADDILPLYDYDRWFIGGHSLGGAMAAGYAADHPGLAGVILCAAYPTKPLDADDLEILLYGSEDGVLNMKKLEAGRQYSSRHVEEFMIPGGNHAQFGNYGPQSGDGEAALTAAGQQELAADFIIRAIGK